MITIDYTISAGSMIEMVIFIAGGIYALGALKTTVTTLKDNVEAGKKETRDSIANLQSETKESVAGLQSEIRKIGDILINQADQNRRIIHLEDDVRELRHGHGYILPVPAADRE